MLKASNVRLNKDCSFGEGGFTVIELVVAALLSLIVMSGIYSVYSSQQKSYIVREQITVMQQNLRAGMVVMTGDIRMAGYVHPFITPAATPGILNTSTNSKLEFTLLADRSENPSPTATALETITYNWVDFDGDGDKDLVKDVHDGTGNKLITENVDWLDFEYIDINDAIIDPSITPDAVMSIQVTMVVKTGKGDPGYTDTNTYANQRKTRSFPPANDNFRRRCLSREIKCRNLNI